MARSVWLAPKRDVDAHPAYERMFRVEVDREDEDYWHGLEVGPGADAVPSKSGLPFIHFWKTVFERVEPPSRTRPSALAAPAK
jgi:hypothetical protein